MPPQTDLLITIAAGLGLAFLLGLLAARLRLPPLVGYLIAGIAVGPHSPGFVADLELAAQLAEIGVILLMFGVGLHFSIRDLLAVRRIALPGALTQIAVATALGTALAHWLWGWSWGAGIVFGMSLSIASTVVLYRSLEERSLVDSVDGRIAVGWLIVQDVATVLALVLLPALATYLGGVSSSATPAMAPAAIASALAVTFLKVAAFVAIMLFAGRRAVPWLLGYVARTGSRELFTLSVLAAALGVAVGAAYLFGVSFALGAFFAGVVISESDLSHQAGADALPLQDAFAVLFFVSVGMLFDPAILAERPLALVLTLLTIVVGNSVTAFAIVLLFRRPLHTALTVSVSLAQIGEFSFILAGLGVTLGLLPEAGRSLILAAAIVSITLNPFLFGMIDAAERWIRARPWVPDRSAARDMVLADLPPSASSEMLRDHAVLVGYGRVGSMIGDALVREEIPFVVIEHDRVRAEALRREAINAIYGDAARAGILPHARIGQAKLLVIAAPGVFQARQIIDLARRANPTITIIARAHSRAEMDYFAELGVHHVLMGERELALGMAHFALRALGRSEQQTDATVQAIRLGHA